MYLFIFKQNYYFLLKIMFEQEKFLEDKKKKNVRVKMFV